MVAQHGRHRHRRGLPPDAGDRDGERHVRHPPPRRRRRHRLAGGVCLWGAPDPGALDEFNSDGDLIRFDRSQNNETDVIAARVVDFVRARRSTQPWPAYVCPHDPHGPYYPAERHEDEFQGATWDPASEGEADLSDKPALVRSEP